MTKILSFILLTLILGNSVFACPNIKRKFVDYNCDQEFKVAVIGDSIVKGYDPSSDITGGYVKRLQRKLRVKVQNLGTNGARANRLVLSLNRDLSSRKYKKRLKKVDVVMVSIGVNDFFDIPGDDQDDIFAIRRYVPAVVRDIKRIGRIIRDNVGPVRKKPYILGGTIIRANRTNQNVYIGELNKAILQAGDDEYHPLVRLDQNFSKLNLNDDNLHPTAIGYKEIAEYLKKFFKKSLRKAMKKDRPDLDNDGLADIHEPSLGTDPTLTDSDHNGIDDGEQLFG